MARRLSKFALYSRLMSFLLLDDAELDDGAVLKEALAFIDALEASPLPLLHDQDAAAPSAGSGSAEADAIRRRRRKQERLTLSREAHVLEQRLALLRGNKRALGSASCMTASENAPVSVTDSAKGEWKRRALAEAHESVASKDLNHKLRNALKRQHALLTAMRDALARAQPKQIKVCFGLGLDGALGLFTD